MGPTTDTEAHDAGGCTPKARASNATARAAADGQTAAQAPAAGPDRPAHPFRPAPAFLKANLARRSLLRWPVGAGRAGDRGHFGVAVLAQWLIVVGLASALLRCIGGELGAARSTALILRRVGLQPSRQVSTKTPPRPNPAAQGLRGMAIVALSMLCASTARCTWLTRWASWFQSKVTKAVCGRGDQPRIAGP